VIDPVETEDAIGLSSVGHSALLGGIKRVRIPIFSKPPSRGSIAFARQGAGSIASAMAGRAHTGPDRYTRRNAEPCAKCKSGRHGCLSIHCACSLCNPEINLI
jgi:hypothetical protein